MVISRTFSPFAKSGKKSPALMNLDGEYYHFLSNMEFVLLARLAVLTNNGEKQCDYTNEQGKQEFNFPSRSIERAFSNLKKFKLIELSRGYALSRHRGRYVRLISLCQTPVVYSSKKGALLCKTI